MSYWESKIAWRYLFAKKSHNAINIVSGVSAAGVCVATAALVCILSVMNGFNQVIEGMFSQFDAELIVRPGQGKSFRLDTQEMQCVQGMPEVDIFSPVVQETAMVEYKEHQTPAIIMGVDAQFQQLAAIDSIIALGKYCVHDGDFEFCVAGYGIASELGANPFYTGGLRLYAPKRKSKVNLMHPDQSLNKETTFLAGTFAVSQEEYDNQYILVDIDCARRLFDYDGNEATAVELKVREASGVTKEASERHIRAAQKKIQNALGEQYVVLNRYEQKADFFRIANIEKWMSALLLVFILLIASFNIVGSLSMLIIDKKNDITILSNLGATPRQIQRVFLYEGWMISCLGAGIGLVIGLVFCLVQQHFGIIKLGTGVEYALSAYPVDVHVVDLLIVAIVVLAIGFATAWYPTRSLNTKGTL